MKVLLLGAGGQVAGAVARLCPPEHTVISKARHELNITDSGALRSTLEKNTVDWVINAAGYTAVDLAEVEISAAQLVNDTAVSLLSNATEDAGCRLLHISTDFVFDGASGIPYTPEDHPNPLNVYGKTKLAGERHVHKQTRNGIVLRTAWIYDSSGKNFLLTMLRLMRDRNEVRVVRDQIGTPTAATSVADTIWKLIEAGASSGTYHWTDDGVASWYDFAVAIQEEASQRGLLPGTIPVLPIASRDYPTRAIRPAFSVLNTDSTRAVTSLPPRHWRQSLREVLDDI